jgi:NAD(P)-dependent dehydrogenase (short-subunit alcohol dehydrogenase family)
LRAFRWGEDQFGELFAVLPRICLHKVVTTMPNTSAKGVAAWVTGAGTGIGRALSRRLAQHGWTVAASARTARDLDSLAAEVPGRITAFQLDVTDAKAADETGRAIEANLGPVDLAILNAGSYFPTTAGQFSVENFRKTVDLNLMGVVNCMGPIVPSMVGGAVATSPSWDRRRRSLVCPLRHPMARPKRRSTRWPRPSSRTSTSMV